MVAVLSRYIVGRGRPGIGTLILVAGLAINIACNLVLIPRYGIGGAAATSSISYVAHRASSRSSSSTGCPAAAGARPSSIRRADIVALVRRARRRSPAGSAGDARGPMVGLRGGEDAADIVIGEHEPGEER